jgi:4'-phosphopantetheinyl transferase
VEHPSIPERLPQAGEVHVWRFDLDVGALDLQRLAATLSPDEQSRAERYRIGRIRDRFIAGRGRLREILGAYHAQGPDCFSFEYGPQGKPSLAPPTGLEFNLSHSANLAILGVSWGQTIGVDVERVDPHRDVQGILTRFFAPGEQEEFLAIAEDDQRSAFYRGWSRKEAFLKALGTGLATALDSFEVSLDAMSPWIRRVGEDHAEPQRWSLRDVDVGDDFAAALVVQGPIARLVIRDWPDARIRPEC